MSKEKTKAVLNQSVADVSKAAALVHQVHWYLRGPGFMKLHPKMDELMDGLNSHLDVLSERLITIGGSPVSTLTEVVKAYKYLSDLFQDGVHATDEEDDDVTNGLFADAKGDIEKTIWMLESELGVAPGL